MKSIPQLHYFACASVILLGQCLTDPILATPSTKGNITPVKLLHLDLKTSPSLPASDSPFGSAAKISRVIPVKRFPDGKYALQNHTRLLERRKGDSNSPLTRLVFGKSKNHKKSKEKIRRVIERIRKVEASNFRNNSKSASTPSTPKTSTTTETTSTSRVGTEEATSTPSPNSSTSESPINSKINHLYLSSKSWSFLNSVMEDVELKQIINELSFEAIQNASSLTKTNPKAAEDYLLDVIMSEFGKLKKSRMLYLQGESDNKVNTGVRYSAKRKPVLNVIPLYKQGNRKENSRDQTPRNVSGHISNPKPDSRNQTSTLKSKGEISNGVENLPAASSIYSSSLTTPSLSNVLIAPEFMNRHHPTAYTPSFPNFPSSTTGFVPMIPMTNHPNNYHTSVTVPMLPSSSEEEQENLEVMDIGISSPSSNLSPPPPPPLVVPGRQPRGPPKEEEYQIPSLTTSSTAKPETTKGYQTIIESTTVGPQIVWYNHQQTPEDTFFPNADNFLVPPEETSLEVQPMKPLHDGGGGMKNPAAFSYHYASSIPINASTTTTFSPIYYDGKSLSEPYKGAHSGEDGGIVGGRGRANRDSPKSLVKSTEVIEMNGRKVNKDTSLQSQGSTVVDHVGGDEFGFKEHYGTSSGTRKPVRLIHEGRRNYGSTSAYDSDINKHHEIVPRYHDKPPYRNTLDDTESYGALNELDHYHDSYPPKHEVGPADYRPGSRDNYNKREPFRERPYGDDRDSGSGRYSRYRDRYPEEGSGPDSFARRPYSDRNRDRHRENSPHGGYGHGHDKDFLSKAKDYFKKSDFATSQKWFEASIGILAFLAFGAYIIMLLYQVFTVSATTQVGTIFGKSLRGAGEMFDVFFSKGPIGQAYMDELETIVKRAMANVKRIWMTKSFAENDDEPPKKVKGETDMDED